MKYESVNQALEQLQKLSKTYMAYVHALGVMELDAATAAPSESFEGRGITAGILSEAMYSLIADPQNGTLGLLPGAGLCPAVLNGADPRDRLDALPYAHSRSALRLYLWLAVGDRRRLRCPPLPLADAGYAPSVPDCCLHGL